MKSKKAKLHKSRVRQLLEANAEDKHTLEALAKVYDESAIVKDQTCLLNKPITLKGPIHVGGKGSDGKYRAAGDIGQESLIGGERFRVTSIHVAHGEITVRMRHIDVLRPRISYFPMSLKKALDIFDFLEDALLRSVGDVEARAILEARDKARRAEREELEKTERAKQAALRKIAEEKPGYEENFGSW